MINPNAFDSDQPRGSTDSLTNSGAEQIVVINKQSDFVVHPAPSCPSGTLVSFLLFFFITLLPRVE